MEFEENMLIVRVAKNSRKVCRIVPDGGEGEGVGATVLGPDGVAPPEEPPCPPSELAYRKPMPVCKGELAPAQPMTLEDYVNPKRVPLEGPERYKMMCEKEGFNVSVVQLFVTVTNNYVASIFNDLTSFSKTFDAEYYFNAID